MAIVDIEIDCLFLEMLLKCDKTLKSLRGGIEFQEALLELEHCIWVLDAWLNPETTTKFVSDDIPLSESRVYVSSLCGRELNDSKTKQKLKNVLSSIKDEINNLKNKRREVCYGKI